MIKNIVFDVGNVLVDFKPKEYIAKFQFQKEIEEQIYEIIFKNLNWIECDRGTYTITEYKKRLKKQYPILQKEIEKVLNEHWVSMHTEKAEMIDWLKQLKKQNYKIYLFSNCAQETYEYLKTLSFYLYIDDGAYSFEEHLCKPEKEIYSYLFQKCAIKPEESIFIDDNVENIKQGIQCGMNGIIFKNIEDAKKRLRDIIEKEVKNESKKRNRSI